VGLRSTFELYLAVSFSVHVWLAIKAAFAKPFGLLAFTGAVLLVFLVKHLFDFRFGGSLDRLAETLPAIVSSQRTLYVVGVLSATVHVFKGIRPAWLFSLGFRGDEITILVTVGKCLLFATTILYSIPLVVL
jgi:hypothetical protein